MIRYQRRRKVEIPTAHQEVADSRKLHSDISETAVGKAKYYIECSDNSVVRLVSIWKMSPRFINN